MRGHSGLGISFHRDSMPPMAVKAIAPNGLAAQFAERLVVGCVLRTVAGKSVEGVAYEDVLGMIRDGLRPIVLGFSQDKHDEEDEL